MEDVTLSEKSEDVLNDINLPYNQFYVDNHLLTGGRCYSIRKIGRCLKRHKFAFQIAEVDKFLQVDDAS